ncbi:HtaA domain-containing protein [Kocuria palustris]|uniref:HtaA domain-containing protein n=1 Tax=Kocuria palustris TaxID=71999 RepID=UPI002043975B|nr:HtaA domain-containing protein [Kocuria palustris]MCM3332451.1 HtaA domain-containing protein [Kocuria palustris]
MATTALLWAVHHDFLRYMSRIEDGQVAAVDGAQQLPDGGFRFPMADDADDSAAEQVARFRGAVVCTGHHGLLAVTIAAPSLIRHDESMAVLGIDDPFAPGQRMPMAELQASPQDPAQFTAVLTEEGADLYQGVYPTGMALAPVRLQQDPTDTQHSSAAVTAGSSIPSTEDLS